MRAMMRGAPTRRMTRSGAIARPPPLSPPAPKPLDDGDQLRIVSPAMVVPHALLAVARSAGERQVLDVIAC